MRSNTTAADELLRRLLAAHLVDDQEAPANYSLQLLPPAGTGAAAQPLNRLFEGPRELVVHRSQGRVVRALITALGGFSPPDGADLQVWATPLASADGVVLAPVEWRRRLPALQRALRRTGWTVMDAPFASLDVGSGHLVSPAPPVAIDAAALADLAATEAEALSGLEPSGLLPLRGWILPPTGADGPLTRSEALTAGMRLCRNRDQVGGRRALALLAEQLVELPLTRAPRTFADGDAAALLSDLLDS